MIKQLPSINEIKGDAEVFLWNRVREIIDFANSLQGEKCEHDYLLRKDLKTACVLCGEEPETPPQIDVEELCEQLRQLYITQGWAGQSSEERDERFDKILETLKALTHKV